MARRITLALMAEHDFEHFYERSGSPYDSGMFTPSEIDQAKADRDAIFGMHAEAGHTFLVDFLDGMSAATINWLVSILIELESKNKS